MQKVTIKKTKLYITILRRNSKIVIARTPRGLIELGEFPIDVDVKVQKVLFDPSLYGEDMLYQIKKALFKKQVNRWVHAVYGKALLHIMTDSNFRVDDKYQLMVFARPTTTNQEGGAA